MGQLLKEGETGSANQVAPVNVMNTFYFRPPFTVDDATEQRFVASMNSTVVGDDNYPGDMNPSANWPMIAPGVRGVLNAIAPIHFNVSALADIAPKPPILWVRGDSDQIVADNSMFDLAALGKLGVVPGWPGDEVCPPQPMIAQTRSVLERYAANGGTYEEVVFEACGHSPHIEKADVFVERLAALIG
jgi:pimeloyl-ACP methyl ester carboxylesterase